MYYNVEYFSILFDEKMCKILSRVKDLLSCMLDVSKFWNELRLGVF
jgi:hypothetical protein